MRFVLALLLSAGAAMAQTPPADYFTGVYERIGRDDATPPGVVNDLVRLSPAKAGLALSVCGEAADTPPVLLVFDRFGDVGNLLSTPEGADWLGCQYFNDMDNYPMLNCHDGKGGRFTLWPVNERAADCAP